MGDRIRLWIEKIRASYWLVPTVLLLAGGGLAYFMTWADRLFLQLEFPWLRWLFSGGAQGAHALLSAIAASVLGVAGTTFTITIAVLTLTSQQYGPRLLRTFLRDTQNQVVLGVFIGTFLYALLVMGMVRSVDEALFVPQLSVAVGLVLAVVSAFMLVYFIQHIVSSIQVSNIVAMAGADMIEAVERMCPRIGEEKTNRHVEDLKLDGAHVRTPAAAVTPSRSLPSHKAGYLQAVDTERIIHKARKAGVRVDIVRQPGEYLPGGSTLARVDPPTSLTQELEEAVNESVSVGSYPTTAQDLAHAPRQLSEIAVRALSPGVNDPGTAVMCLDQLTNGLCELVRRQMPPNSYEDEEGVVRLTLRRPTFEVVLDVALAQIRRYGSGDIEVLSRILRLLSDVGESARSPAQRAALEENAELVLVEGRQVLKQAEALARLAAEYDLCREHLGRRLLPR